MSQFESESLGPPMAWEQHERWSPPLEQFVDRQITPAQALDFIKGCRTVFSIVRQVEPDVIFVPERGATPVSDALDVFMNEDSQHFERVFLPIGTKTDPNTGNESGFTIPEKQELIGLELERFDDRRRASAAAPTISRPLIIDEVQQGGTIMRATNTLKRQLKDKYDSDKIVVTAMQDTRVPHLKKVKGFRSMLANEKEGVTAFSVNLPQVFMDRRELLNTLLLAPDESLDRLRIIPNLRAKRLIGALATGLVRPDRFSTAIDAATESDSVSARAEDWVDEYQRLCERENAVKNIHDLGYAAVSFFSDPGGQA